MTEGPLARLYALQLADLATRLQGPDLESLGDSFPALAVEIEQIVAIDTGAADPAVRLTFEDWELE